MLVCNKIDADHHQACRRTDDENIVHRHGNHQGNAKHRLLVDALSQHEIGKVVVECNGRIGRLSKQTSHTPAPTLRAVSKTVQKHLNNGGENAWEK